jgi:hypothetical protein
MTRSLRVSLLTIVSVLMVGVLSACGSTVLPTPKASSPTAAAVSTAAPGMQIFSVTDQMNGTLSVSAPVGTFSKSDPADGSLTLGTTEASLSASDTSVFSAGQWGLSLGALPMNVAQAMAPGNALTPQIVIDTLKAQMATSVTQVTFGSSAPTTLGGHAAARVTGTSPQGDVLLLAVALDNSYLLVTGVTAKGDLATREALLTTIVASATYSIPK